MGSGKGLTPYFYDYWSTCSATTYEYVIPHVIFDEDTPFPPQERARERIGGGVGGLPAVPTKIEEVPFRYFIAVEHFLSNIRCIYVPSLS